jgi:hypothetical protein
MGVDGPVKMKLDCRLPIADFKLEIANRKS